MNRKFLILGAALILGLPQMAGAQEPIKSHMQLCQANADCTIAATQCGARCEAIPINRAHLPSLQSLAGDLCVIGEQSAGTCHIEPELQSACIGGKCTVATAWQRHGEPEDYRQGYGAMARGVVEELEFTVPADDRDGRFTAYDLPPQIVEQETLGQIKRK